MRIIILIFFLVLLFIQYRNPKYSNLCYKISLGGYLIFLSLRYLQGTDYIEYLNYYNNEVSILEAFSNGFNNKNFEILYNLISSFFKTMNVPFFIFLFLINFFVLMLFNRFLKCFSSNKQISLILLYLQYGIVFIESTIRQSIAIAIILGVSMIAFKNKDLKTLLISSFLAFGFHRTSILISAIIMLWYFISNKYEGNKLKEFLLRNAIILTFIFILISFVINFVPFEHIFSNFGGEFAFKLSVYFSQSDISITSIILRGVYLVLSIYFYRKKRINIFKIENFIYLFYLFSFILYFLTIRFPIMSRMTVYFEILEIVIFVDLILEAFTPLKKWSKYFAVASYCCLTLLLFFKDGYATQIQSNYKNVSIIYPYYTYFDKERAENNIEE